jgi:hypothetical protein
MPVSFNINDFNDTDSNSRPSIYFVVLKPETIGKLKAAARNNNGWANINEGNGANVTGGRQSRRLNDDALIKQIAKEISHKVRGNISIHSASLLRSKDVYDECLDQPQGLHTDHDQLGRGLEGYKFDPFAFSLWVSLGNNATIDFLVFDDTELQFKRMVVKVRPCVGESVKCSACNCYVAMLGCIILPL